MAQHEVTNNNLSFSTALLCMHMGKRVRRVGWNGKDMWICIGKGGVITADQFWNEHTRKFAEEQPNQKAEVLPYVIMKTADGKILMGWLASQTDMLANDWEELA